MGRAIEDKIINAAKSIRSIKKQKVTVWRVFWFLFRYDRNGEVSLRIAWEAYTPRYRNYTKNSKVGHFLCKKNWLGHWRQ